MDFLCALFCFGLAAMFALAQAFMVSYGVNASFSLLFDLHWVVEVLSLSGGCVEVVALELYRGFLSGSWLLLKEYNAWYLAFNHIHLKVKKTLTMKKNIKLLQNSDLY